MSEWLPYDEATAYVTLKTGITVPHPLLEAAIERGEVRIWEPQIDPRELGLAGLSHASAVSAMRREVNAVDLRAWVRKLVKGEGAPSVASNSPPARVSPSPAAVERFLQGFADGQKTKAECREAVNRHFSCSVPHKNVFEPAWKALPHDKKRPRGKPANTKQR